MKILEEHGCYNDSMCSEIIDVDRFLIGMIFRKKQMKNGL